MIADELELEYSIQSIARMYTIRDRQAAETLHDPETREDLVESTVSMIRKIEREIAEYLAAKYGYVRPSAELPAVPALISEQAAREPVAV